MAFLSVSGEPGCRYEEVARSASERLNFELLTESRLTELAGLEFHTAKGIPGKAWAHLARSIVAKRGVERSVVISGAGAEALLEGLPDALRAYVVAPHCRRLARRQSFDLILNGGTLGMEQMADIVESAARAKGFLDAALLPPEKEAQIQFEVRLKLARFGIALAERVAPPPKQFVHPSEEVFANLLDFYRIAWDYEPRSFALQWNKDGKVSEAFTPDFYLPEFDLYVELTTMKQAHVTKKNRKVRLLKAIYPHVNIQVFYQKDVQDLVMKYGLPERLAR